MSNSKTIKTGVIGAGYLGEFHIQQLQTISDVEFVGFVESNPERASAIGEKYNVQLYQKQSDLIGLCDAVIIATPTVTHHTIANDALNNGCHVFIEKPIATTISEAHELIAVSEKNNLMIQVGHIERFNPAFLLLKEKNINPQFVEVHRLASFKSRGHDTSVVLDLMIHDIDIILDIIQAPVQDIQANGVKVITNETDIANARITFENGCIVNLTSSRISLKEMRKMRIFQEKSYMNIDFLNKSLEEYSLTDNQNNTDDNSQLFPYDESNNQFIMYKKNDSNPTNALQEELKHFISCIQKATTPTINGNVATEALNIALIIQGKINENK